MVFKVVLKQFQYGKLQRAIEDIQELPNAEEIEEVTQKVKSVEEDINLITVE